MMLRCIKHIEVAILWVQLCGGDRQHPEKLYEKARERGIDVESFITDSLARELGLDPDEEAGVHVELAEKMFERGRELLDKGDVTQASEKFYKVAEECIKALSLTMGLGEASEARARGR